MGSVSSYERPCDHFQAFISIFSLLANMRLYYLETGHTMKTCLSILSALVMSLMASFQAQARPQIPEQPNFRIQIDSDGTMGFKFTLTNRSTKTLTACAFEFFVSSESKGQSRALWDAFIQNVPPLKLGESFSDSMPHRVGGPYPDRVEVTAGVWEDGETFGDAQWVKVILETRAGWHQKLTRASALLQHGLDQNWNYDQFLEALKAMPPSADPIGIVPTFEANPRLEQDPKQLQILVQRLLDRLKQKTEVFDQAKPASSPTP